MPVAVDVGVPGEFPAAGAIVAAAVVAAIAWYKVREGQAELAERLVQRLAQVAPPATDEAAARALGEALRVLSPNATAEVMAAFWAAEAPARRTLAHVVAGLTRGGHGDEERVLAAVRGLRATPAAGPKPAPSQE